MLSGLINGIGEAPLRWAEFRTAQQFGHAENTVHRRAYLMAHGGQELALGATAGFRILLCPMRGIDHAV